MAVDDEAGLQLVRRVDQSRREDRQPVSRRERESVGLQKRSTFSTSSNQAECPMRLFWLHLADLFLGITAVAQFGFLGPSNNERHLGFRLLARRYGGLENRLRVITDIAEPRFREWGFQRVRRGSRGSISAGRQQTGSVADIRCRKRSYLSGSVRSRPMALLACVRNDAAFVARDDDAKGSVQTIRDARAKDKWDDHGEESLASRAVLHSGARQMNPAGTGHGQAPVPSYPRDTGPDLRNGMS